MNRRVAAMALAACVAAAGCATYTARMSEPGVFYYDGEYDRALGKLDELAVSSSSEDRCLYLLERGKVRLAAGHYDSAIVDLRDAERRFDEIEGTASVVEMISTSIVSDGSAEYHPESHEKILLNTYLLLSFWLSGDLEGAYVERNRVIGRLENYLGNAPAGGDSLLDVTFARYVAALLYENEGRLDDARIEYDRIRASYPEAVPEAPNSHMTELAVIAEMGRAPVKVSREIRGYFEKVNGRTFGYFNLPGDAGQQVYPVTSSLLSGDAELGTVFTFAFPEYVRMPRQAVTCKPVIDGVEAGTAVTLDDLEETAMQAFRRDIGTILIKSAIRTYLQLLAQNKLDGDAGKIASAVAKFFSLVERADTRSWQTLPSEIAVFRMEVDPGCHEVYVRYYDERGKPAGESPAWQVWVEKGKKQISWMPGSP